MRWWLLLALCACNRIFGLSPTAESKVDAQFFDAPVDAPFTCPPIGTTPRFETDPHQVIYDKCFGYQRSANGIAKVDCLNAIDMGAWDGPFAPAADLAEDATYFRTGGWLAPDGDQIYMQEMGKLASVNQFARFVPNGSGGWTRVDTLVFPSQLYLPYFISTPTRTVPRHAMVLDNHGYLAEVIDDGTANLQFVRAYSNLQLGIANFNGPQLSPDGLRLVIYGTAPQPDGSVLQSVWYSDRPSIDADFRTFDPLPDVPLITDPFFTEDCSRLYFSGIGSIWYVQQR